VVATSVGAADTSPFGGGGRGVGRVGAGDLGQIVERSPYNETVLNWASRTSPVGDQA
jgi:hypothetical protein